MDLLPADQLWTALLAAPPAWLQPLHDANRALWQLEAAVRDRSLTARQVADLKREIDAHNLARHAAVAAIDLAVDAQFRPVATLATPGVVVNSESVGQLLDRLSILALKWRALADTPRASGMAARVARVGFCLDRVVAALAEGRALPQAFDEGKTYGA